MLLTSLNPSAVTATDIPDAVRIDGTVLSRADLLGAATSVAERVAGAGRVAVLATPTAATVLAVTGCLIAGVPFVPVPADVGAAERRHMLADSGCGPGSAPCLTSPTACRTSRCGCTPAPGTATPSRHRTPPR